MMNKFNRCTLVISLFFCFVFVIAFWQFAHKYAQQRILQSDLERQKLAQISLNILNYKNKYGDLDEYMKRLEERFQRLDKILPERMQQGEVVSFLQRTALENQIKIISLTPSSIQPVDADSTEVSKLPISIKIECKYISLIHFLKSLEASERLINVEDISIISKGDGDWLTCDLIIIIFAMSKN